jgi:hypothetical protein
MTRAFKVCEGKEGVMRDKQKWLKLCEQAAFEQDPEKLLALVEQIDALLQIEEDRLRGSLRSEPPSSQAEGEHESFS